MAVLSLAAIERRLVQTCTHIPALDDGLEEDARDDALSASLRAVESAEYVVALRRALPEILGAWSPSAPRSTQNWFAGVEECVLGCEAAEKLAILLVVGVAALLQFLELAVVGPERAELRGRNLPDVLLGSFPGAPAAYAAPAPALGQDSVSPEDSWAADCLVEDGEEVSGRVAGLQFLLLARVVLLPRWRSLRQAAEEPSGGSSACEKEGLTARHSLPSGAGWSWAWWASRALALQQRVLGGQAPSLQAAASALSEAALTGLEARGRSTPALRAAILAEAAGLDVAGGELRRAEARLDEADAALGLRHALSGALGRRTAHQGTAVAQMVVVLGREGTQQALSTKKSASPTGQDALLSRAQCDALLGAPGTALAGLQKEEQDVLELPMLESEQAPLSAGVPAASQSLSAAECALFLARAEWLRAAKAHEALPPEEAGAYVDAIWAQDRIPLALRAGAQLARSRAERARGRTRERALVALESLERGLSSHGDSAAEEAASSLPVAVRRQWAFAAALPALTRLRRELGESLVALGAVGDALALFESLELWENLAVCLQMLGRQAQAEALLSARVRALPQDARLWCALGDVRGEAAAYERAWEISRGRSARAQRSLARLATADRDYPRAAGHWERALALNPQHASGWFSLGYCAIRMRDGDLATRAFTRAVQLDSFDGEAWHNLAAVHMHAQRWPQALAALAEAVKHKRDSWQTWENYAQAAAEAGQWGTALRALGECLRLSQGGRMRAETLGQVVDYVVAGVRGEGPRKAAEDEGHACDGDDDDDGIWDALAALDLQTSAPETDLASSSPPDSSSEQQAADARHWATMTRALDRLFREAADGSAAAAPLWRLQGRWSAALGRRTAAGECFARCARAAQAQPWRREREAFRGLASALRELAAAHLAAAGEGDLAARGALSSVRLQLRSVLKASEEAWKEDPARAELEACLAEVQDALA